MPGNEQLQISPPPLFQHGHAKSHFWYMKKATFAKSSKNMTKYAQIQKAVLKGK